MAKPKAIFLADLLDSIDQELLRLLGSLPGDAWSQPTIAGNWTVKDVAGHLLDGNRYAGGNGMSFALSPC